MERERVVQGKEDLLGYSQRRKRLCLESKETTTNLKEAFKFLT